MAGLTNDVIFAIVFAMGNENIEPEFPDTTKHIGGGIVDYLNDTLGPRVSEDEEKIRENAVNAAKRKLNTRRTLTLNELAASDAEGADLAEYAGEVNDPGVEQALEETKRVNVQIYNDAKELPPPQV